MMVSVSMRKMAGAFADGSEAFRYWDTVKPSWVVEPGTFDIHVGASSADIRLRGRVTL